MSTLITPVITELGDERELKFLLPADLLAELGLEQAEPMTLEVVDGKLVMRRATVVERTAGMGAPWRKIPPLSIEEEKEAVARAIAEENAGYE